jgi:probable rRNA maturation factor
MIDPNPEPDSLTPVHAGDEDAMSAYDGIGWTTPDDHQIDIIIDHDSWPAKAGDQVKLGFCRMFDAALAAHDMKSCAVSLLLCSDDKIRQLNFDHRGKDKATNVLSFPAADEDHAGDQIWEQLGDIAIAYETCVREADESGISTHNHVTHLFLHGVLHLLGYDHENDDDANEMETLETSLLAAIDIANPYRDLVEDDAKDDAAKNEIAMTEPAS